MYQNHKRSWKVCSLHATEEEKDFILVCPIYADLRSKYIPKHISIHQVSIRHIFCWHAQMCKLSEMLPNIFIMFFTMKTYTWIITGMFVHGDPMCMSIYIMHFITLLSCGSWVVTGLSAWDDLLCMTMYSIQVYIYYAFVRQWLVPKL